MANGDDPDKSSQFPPRPCPKCRQKIDVPCDLCGGGPRESRWISRFKAAGWLLQHPEYNVEDDEVESEP